MKVKCIKVTDMTGKKDMGQSNGVYSVNNIYYVLSINLDLEPTRKSYVQIESDNLNSPILVNILNFDFIDNIIPSNFGIYMNKEKLLFDLEPRAWNEYKSDRGQYGFWEDFFDNERVAVELYRREVAFIKEEPYEPLPKEKPSAQELLEIYRRKERDHLIPNQGFNEAFAPIPLTSTDEWGKKLGL